MSSNARGVLGTASRGPYHGPVIIPLGTDRPLARPTVVTPVIIGLNLVVFAIGMAMQRPGANPAAYEEFIRPFVLDPLNVKPWALITSAFLHAGAWHILGNMLFLWVFGPCVEDRFGRIGFVVFYLAGAVVSGGLHALFVPNPVLGASGAIAAVTGAFMVLFPRTHVKAFLFFFLIGIYEIPAGWFIAGQIAWDLFSQASGRSGDIATLAHLAGYGFGAAVAMTLLATGILKREMYDLFSISKHAARRRQFREMKYQTGREAARGRQDRQSDKTRSADPALADEVAKARAEVTENLLAGEVPAAAAAYRRLLEKFGAVPGATLLSRRMQYELANGLFSAGDHQTAATAYQQFLSAYPSDPEEPMVRLMLGLISARYLNDPVRAKAEIGKAMEGLPDGANKDLAREILAELG